MTTNPQDNFIQEAVERFEKFYGYDEPMGEDTDDTWKVYQSDSRDGHEVIAFIRATLEAQKSHIKETLMAGMAGEREIINKILG